MENIPAISNIQNKSTSNSGFEKFALYVKYRLNKLNIKAYIPMKYFLFSNLNILITFIYINIDNCILFLAKSTSKTLTSTISPTLTISRGCFTNLSASCEI